MKKYSIICIFLCTSKLLQSVTQFMTVFYAGGKNTAPKFLLVKNQSQSTTKFKGFYGLTQNDADTKAKKFLSRTNLPQGCFLTQSNNNTDTIIVNFCKIDYIDLTEAEKTRHEWIRFDKVMQRPDVSYDFKLVLSNIPRGILGITFSLPAPPTNTYDTALQKTLSWGPWPPKAHAAAYSAFKTGASHTVIPQYTNDTAYNFLSAGYNTYKPMGTEKWETSGLNKPLWNSASIKKNGAQYILFYGSNKPFNEFSNFAKNPIYVDDGSTEHTAWPTSEHYFQAHKFKVDSSDYKTTKTQNGPLAAFNYARSKTTNNPDIAPNWRTESLDVMLKALWAKFTQHDNLRDILTGRAPSGTTDSAGQPVTATYNSVLIEDSLGRDSNWGNGIYGDGLNHLGQMLMYIRARLLRQIPADEPYVWRKPSDLKAWLDALPPINHYATTQHAPTPILPAATAPRSHIALENIAGSLQALHKTLGS